jgi:hypothetical protein
LGTPACATNLPSLRAIPTIHSISLSSALSMGALLAPALKLLQTRYALTSISAYERGGRWWARIRINPEVEQDLAPSGSAKDGDKKPGAKEGDKKVGTPAEIIAKVKADLASRSRDFDTVAGFKAMIELVAKGTPGLKAIRVRPGGKNEWKIEASASPFTLAGIVSTMDMSGYGSTWGTVAFDDVVYGDKVKNQRKKLHAEDKLIGFIRTHLNQLIRMKKPLPQKVEVFVTQSPCKERCTPNLMAVKAQYPTIPTWVVYYHTLHQSTSGINTKESQEAVDLLKQDGFHVFIWKDALDMQAAGLPVP